MVYCLLYSLVNWTLAKKCWSHCAPHRTTHCLAPSVQLDGYLPTSNTHRNPCSDRSSCGHVQTSMAKIVECIEGVANNYQRDLNVQSWEKGKTCQHTSSKTGLLVSLGSHVEITQRPPTECGIVAVHRDLNKNRGKGCSASMLKPMKRLPPEQLTQQLPELTALNAFQWSLIKVFVTTL